MIHYHGGPITPNAAAVTIWTRRHAMASFFEPRQVSLAAEVAQSFALDNGAFSAWTAGTVVTDWSDYLAWVREWCQHPGFDWALIPDTIDGTSEDNDELVAWWKDRAPKIESVPVWHLHEPFERLERLSRSWRTVALGSSGQYAVVYSDAWKHRMAEAMGWVCDASGRPRCRLHGLRMLDPRVFSVIPLRSADSTNVARNIGLDKAWKGTYPPVTEGMRGLVLAERIEHHVAAPRWMATWEPPFNLELVG